MKIYWTKGHGLIIKKPCPICGEIQTVNIPEKDVENFIRYKNGIGHIQDMLPELSAIEREVLITGTCSICWVNLFGGDELD